MSFAPVSPACRTTVICVTVFAFIAAAVPARAERLLWNKLGSQAEVLDSAEGPDLSFFNAPAWVDVIGNPAYVPGVFGGALSLAPGSYANLDRVHNVVWNNVDQHLDADRGTIEVWYKQNADPVEFSHGVYRIFDGAYGLGSGVSFTSEAANGPALNFGLDFGGTYTQVSTNISGHNGSWVHLAGVWDRDGIAGGNDKLRLYVNGAVAASTTTASWGSTVGQRADIGGGNDGSIAGRFALDNLKVYDTALTDFSHRFDEASVPEPAGAAILLAGFATLACRLTRRAAR